MPALTENLWWIVDLWILKFFLYFLFYADDTWNLQMGY